MFDNIPPDLKTLVPGALGSALAAVFIKDHWGLKIIKAIGGCAVAFYGTHPVATYFSWNDYQGLVGLLVGLFAMSIIAKLWEIVDGIQAREVFGTLRDWVRSKAGLPAKEEPK